jgi:protein-S-isoprenylcysteine O-methyltransferase Ste14
MVSTWFKGILSELIGNKFMKCYYRLFFVVFSATAVCIAFFVIMSLPDLYIFRAPLWLKLPMYSIQISGLIFGMMSLRALDFSEFFGIRQIKRCWKEKNPDLTMLSIDGSSKFRLSTDGVYSIVRHPIYLAGIIMLSFQPDVTYNRLVVTIIGDIYFIYGACKEEYLLMRNTEVQYGKYAQDIPMFNIFRGINDKICKKR